MTLSTREEMIAWSASYTHRGVGYQVIDNQSDTLTCILTLTLKEPKSNKIYVTATRFDEDSFILSIVTQKHEQHSPKILSISVGWPNLEFRDMQLPANENDIDALYDARGLDTQLTLPDHLINSFRARDGNDDEWDSLFTDPSSRLDNTRKFDEPVIPKEFTGKVPQKQGPYDNRIAKDNVSLPKFDDEYEMNQGRSALPQSSSFPSVGDSDLYPMGQKYPSLNPNPAYQQHPNGMIVDKSHPLFAGRVGGPGGPGNPGGPGHPPGARYDDPIGEFGSEGMGLPHGSYRGFGSGSGGGGGFGPGDFM